MTTSSIRILLITWVFLLPSCGGEPDEAAPADSETAPLTGMEGMPGMEMPGMEMPGMAGMQGGMMAQMETQMESMMGAGADSMAVMLPMHRQMLANTIAEANREMREMNMPGDAVWNALVDSLRADLTRMPEMGGAELGAFMPEHGRRVMGLLDMHRAMMAGMGM